MGFFLELVFVYDLWDVGEACGFYLESYVSAVDFYEEVNVVEAVPFVWGRFNLYAKDVL